MISHGRHRLEHVSAVLYSLRAIRHDWRRVAPRFAAALHVAAGIVQRSCHKRRLNRLSGIVGLLSEITLGNATTANEGVRSDVGGTADSGHYLDNSDRLWACDEVPKAGWRCVQPVSKMAIEMGRLSIAALRRDVTNRLVDRTYESDCLDDAQCIEMLQEPMARPASDQSGQIRFRHIQRAGQATKGRGRIGVVVQQHAEGVLQSGG